MKKLLIATTALVATAGMASADITISGSANAGYYSGLGNADAVTVTSAEVANGPGVLGAAAVAATSAETYTSSGVYSNAGIVATMSGTTDNGITFSTSVDAEAGTEIDQGDFEFDGAAGGTFGLGAVSMSGAFGTITFDDGGIDNLYDDDLTKADIKYSTTLGAVSLSIAGDADSAADGTSISAGYTSGAMTFAASGSTTSTDNSMSVGVTYVLSDSITLTADTDSTAGAAAVNSVSVSTALNGVSITAATDSASTWDLDLGYSVSGIALTYGTDENDAWDATATYSLGGGATIKAGINAEDSAYAGVALAF